jgi:hypothetical protein
MLATSTSHTWAAMALVVNSKHVLRSRRTANGPRKEVTMLTKIKLAALPSAVLLSLLIAGGARLRYR